MTVLARFICQGGATLLLLSWYAGAAIGAEPDSFAAGTAAYRAGDNATAANAFRQAVVQRPASGTLQNLGVAEWQRGGAGAAILAWEQALWVDPFNRAARENLRFARKTLQLEAPELAWYEVVSSWLPLNWWVCIAGLSFWAALGIGLLPGLLRLHKASWQQAIATFCLAIFLLGVPAHVGLETRAHLGFVLEKDTPLRLTPTDEAQIITRLPAGEPARLERARGSYVLVRTGHTRGWLQKTQLGLVTAPLAPANAVPSRG